MNHAELVMKEIFIIFKNYFITNKMSNTIQSGFLHAWRRKHRSHYKTSQPQAEIPRVHKWCSELGSAKIGE